MTLLPYHNHIVHFEELQLITLPSCRNYVKELGLRPLQKFGGYHVVYLEELQFVSLWSCHNHNEELRPLRHLVVTMSYSLKSCKLWLFDHAVTMSKSFNPYNTWCPFGLKQLRFRPMSIPSRIPTSPIWTNAAQMVHLLKNISYIFLFIS